MLDLDKEFKPNEDKFSEPDDFFCRLGDRTLYDLGTKAKQYELLDELNREAKRLWKIPNYEHLTPVELDTYDVSDDDFSSDYEQEPIATKVYTIGCEIGDDTADVSNSVLFCLLKEFVTETMLGMKISKEDTFVSKTHVNIAEETFWIPASYNCYRTAIKTGHVSELAYKDLPKIRTILDVRKGTQEHGDRPSGKASYIGNFIHMMSPMTQAIFHFANYIQDGCLGSTKIEVPKYLHRKHGGAGAPPPYGNVENVYNYLLTYKNGSYNRYYENVMNEFNIRCDCLQDGIPIPEAVFTKHTSSRGKYKDWIYGNRSFVIGNAKVPSQLRLPYGFFSGAEIHPRSVSQKQACQRLAFAGLLYTEDQVNILVNANILYKALLQSKKTVNDYIEEKSTLLKQEYDNCIKEAGVEALHKKCKGFTASRKDFEELMKKVDEKTLKSFKGVNTTLSLHTVETYYENLGKSLQQSLDMNTTYYDAETVDASLASTRWDVADIRVSDVKLVGSLPREIKRVARRYNSLLNPITLWEDEALESVREGKDPPTDYIEDDPQMMIWAKDMVNQGYSEIAFVTADRARCGIILASESKLQTIYLISNRFEGWTDPEFVMSNLEKRLGRHVPLFIDSGAALAFGVKSRIDKNIIDYYFYPPPWLEEEGRVIRFIELEGETNASCWNLFPNDWRFCMTRIPGRAGYISQRTLEKYREQFYKEKRLRLA